MCSWVYIYARTMFCRKSIYTHRKIHVTAFDCLVVMSASVSMHACMHARAYNCTYLLKAPQVKQNKRCVTNYALPPICHWLHGQRLVSLDRSCFFLLFLFHSFRFSWAAPNRIVFIQVGNHGIISKRKPTVCDCNLLIFFFSLVVAAACGA